VLHCSRYPSFSVVTCLRFAINTCSESVVGFVLCHVVGAGVVAECNRDAATQYLHYICCIFNFLVYDIIPRAFQSVSERSNKRFDIILMILCVVAYFSDSRR
jgi:uncharacterized membrane protein